MKSLLHICSKFAFAGNDASPAFFTTNSSKKSVECAGFNSVCSSGFGVISQSAAINTGEAGYLSKARRNRIFLFMLTHNYIPFVEMLYFMKINTFLITEFRKLKQKMRNIIAFQHFVTPVTSYAY